MSPLLASMSEAPSGRAYAASEDLLAELTDAAYRAALQHGLSGNFLEAQLDIWSALRTVLDRQRSPSLRVVAER